MSDLTLKEIKEKKKELEFEISMMVKEFTKVTGITIEDITPKYIILMNDLNEKQSYLSHSEIRLGSI